MNSFLLRIIEGLVRGRVIKPPQLALLHANFVPSNLEVTAIDALQREVISVTQQPVEPIVRVGVDPAMGCELCQNTPTHGPIHDPNESVHIL